MTLTLAVIALTAVASADASRSSNYTQARRAIFSVFGPYASQAMRVSYCETGGSYSVWAQNGQYHGIFQMGSWERRTYGDSSNVWGQARAAYAYFVASGRDWSPWQCKP